MTSDDWLKDVAADAAEAAAEAIPDTAKLSELGKLVSDLQKYDEDVAEAEVFLKKLSEQRRLLSEVAIPNLMHELGIKSFKLSNGAEVKISPFYSGTIKGPEAFAWFEENGFADMVKSTLSVPLRRSDSEAVFRISQWLENEGVSFSSKESVHPSTLGAWIRSRLENGKPLPPEEILSTFTGFKTRIK
jgi:hypothetical protein